MPHIEVTEENIDRFALVELTGNTREEMLSRAAEARMTGYTLSVEVPDNLIKLNIFDVAPGTEVKHEELTNDRCRYELRMVQQKYREDEERYFCIIHNRETHGDPEQDPQTPCMGVLD